MKPIYSVVIPVYNEELVLEESYKRLTEVMRKISEPYELIFVNDGSRDNSLSILSRLKQNDKYVKFISFSRNFGHQAAITAGMDYASGDAVIVIDADLQDPPEIIPEMISEWRNGFDVVYGKRSERKGETFFKKFTAKLYYRTLKKITNIDIPVDTGDFRLISRRVCDTMNQLSERSRYVRGLVSWVGYKQKAVEYVREDRFAGETKYHLSKMIKLALDGVTAFSYKPLKLASIMGFIMFALSFIWFVVMICRILLVPGETFGWGAAVPILLMSQGIVLLILGILGEYVGRIFEEIKGRPIYIVSEKEGFEEPPKTLPL